MAIVLGTDAGFVSDQPGDPSGYNSDGRIDNNALAFKDTSPAGTYNVTTIGCYIYNACSDTNMQVGLYSHDGTNNRPNARLATSGDFQKGTDAGHKTASVSFSLDESTSYWIAAQSDRPEAVYIVFSDGNNTHYKESQTELPESWGEDGNFNRLYSLYAIYAPAGGVEVAVLMHHYTHNMGRQ
jgi:hypothetical protein